MPSHLASDSRRRGAHGDVSVRTNSSGSETASHKPTVCGASRRKSHFVVGLGKSGESD